MLKKTNNSEEWKAEREKGTILRQAVEKGE